MNLNINATNASVPMVEKWRPTKFEHIVLDPLNKVIMKNIIDTGYFPNLLFYGPPGTGKTTSIINLIDAYQGKHNYNMKGLVIHLNASDERGIDIIRSQISQFVNSKALFNQGMKFVILDEVDYMTKNAQQALRYLLQSYSSGVRFCLICNYISRIDEGLQNEFLRLRFNQLPETDIINFLLNIANEEKLNMNKDKIQMIQQLYKSDMRSMINFMQTNQNHSDDATFNIINNNVLDELYCKFENGEKINIIIKFIQKLSMNYNIDKKNIIKHYLNYIIRNKKEIVNSAFLAFVENIMHFQDCKNSHFINYSISSLLSFTSSKNVNIN